MAYNDLCPLPPQIYGFNHEYLNSTNNLQQNQRSFVQGIGYDNRAQYMGYITNSSSSSNTTTFTNNNNDISLMNSIVCYQSFSDLLDNHGHELDHYLHFQGEKLKEALQQQKKQQMALILNNYQSKVMALLRQKEQDLQNLRAKTKMLEEYLRKKEEEAQVWQKIAREKNEMVIELNNMMKQNLRDNDNDNDNDDDTESVCDCETLKKNGRGNDSNEEMKYGCKWCKCKEMCVVFFPCKHVCCCKQCEPLLQFCLVCQSPKQTCMEILLS
ncbi:hypothetical protein RND81_02G066000 [Saponaria officinalis]|uniref:RING-type domain-containing protein n=1 Tax=Saponaria officinalis TaxID=3572 RepID=A0AAW1ML20_SAPOF